MSDTRPKAIADALVKLDQAIGLLTDPKASRSPGVEMAVAALESARMDLLGQKPS